MIGRQVFLDIIFVVVNDLLFRITWTSNKTIYISSKSNLQPCNTFLDKTLILRTNLSKNPLRHSAKGKFILQSAPKLCTNVCVSSETKFLATSEMTLLCTTTSSNEPSKTLLINEWESRCDVRSRMTTARLAAQVYNVTHTLNKVKLSCFIEWTQIVYSADINWWFLIFSVPTDVINLCGKNRIRKSRHFGGKAM